MNFIPVSLRASIIKAAALRNSGFKTYQQLPPNTEWVDIPSRDADRHIKAVLYKSSSDTAGPTPVLLNFHGSGFVIPLHGSDSEFCAYIAQETPYTVLDVDYRKSPKHPFPAAANDVEDAVRWVLSQSERFDASGLTLCGFSAGGNLALGASCESLFPAGTVKNVIAFYPPLDLFTEPGTKKAPDASGKPIPAFVARTFDEAYVGYMSREERKDPRVSPLYAEPASFPQNVMIVSCAQDSLALEAEDLAEKIAAVEGKRVVKQRMEGCGHSWDKDAKPDTAQGEAKNRAYRMVVEFLTS